MTENIHNHSQKVLFIIVTYNGIDWVNQCLNSIENSTIPTLTLVIDNCSTDQTVNFIRNNYPKTIIINLEINYGFGKANNIGLKYAIKRNVDYVFLLNQDAFIECDTIAKLLSLHSQNPHFGIISPLHLGGNAIELDPLFSTFIPYKTLTEIRSELENVLTEDIPESLGFVQKSIGKITSLLDSLVKLARLGKSATVPESDEGLLMRQTHHDP